MKSQHGRLIGGCLLEAARWKVSFLFSLDFFLNIVVWSAVHLNNFKTSTLFSLWNFFFMNSSWMSNLAAATVADDDDESGGTGAPTSIQGSMRRKRKQLTEALDSISLVFFFVFKYEMKHSTSRHWSYSNRNLAPISWSMTPTWLYQRFKKTEISYLHI